MGRAPCCEKMGLKKGPWTREEDHLLITYINQHGHGNWRALPKKAGLLRCGKSCRLRWTNYLRPDIKRGNFSKEEEDTIIQLHQVLGNRWSAIAARLPGRTDNEIKNVWHTHLKKRLFKQSIPETHKQQIEKVNFDHHHTEDSRTLPESSGSIHCQPNSPPHSSSSSDVSSSITSTTNPDNAEMCAISNNLHSYPNLDEDFWIDVVSSENSGKFSCEDVLSFPLSPLNAVDYSSSFNSNTHNDDMDLWSDLFTRAEELLKLPEF